MAITRTETQVTWSAANNVVVAGNGTQTSDTVTLDATCVNAQIHLKAANGGTPVAADVIYFWLLQTGGDPDGTGSDEFDTTDSSTALFLGAINTNAVATGITTVPLPLPQKSLQIYADGATSTTTQNITVSATITEQRAA